jgi:hypothetical protein
MIFPEEEAPPDPGGPAAPEGEPKKPSLKVVK